MSAITGILSVLLLCPAQGGDSNCKIIEQEIKEYDTNVFKFIFKLGGLFGSTRSCHKTTIKTTICCTAGEPRKKGDEAQNPVSATPSGSGGSIFVDPSGLNTIASGPFGPLELRVVGGMAPCYGGLLQPASETEVQRVDFMSIDGHVVRLAFEPVSSSLGYFLGQSFDASPFDPFFRSAMWPGWKAAVPAALFLEPSLLWSTGMQDPEIPVSALMNLDAPDAKSLHADLGPQAGGAIVTTLVSATPPTDGPLARFGATEAAVVFDGVTRQFLITYPELVQIADAEGRVNIDFPQINDVGLEGSDFYIAVVALDSVTGDAVAASTWVLLRLRDLSLCAD